MMPVRWQISKPKAKKVQRRELQLIHENKTAAIFEKPWVWAR